jgi:hypothetical protein
MNRPRASDTQTLGVLVTGGIGVLVVVAFVAAVVFGGETKAVPGDRVKVAAADEPGRAPVVFVGRCPDERVRSVEVRTPEGRTLWRVVSDKGTIDRAFVIGEDPPAFFATTVRLEGRLPGGELEAVVQVDDVTDARPFDTATLERGGDGPGADCGDRDLGLVPLVFVVGAAMVIGAYAVMVVRALRSRVR